MGLRNMCKCPTNETKANLVTSLTSEIFDRVCGGHDCILFLFLSKRRSDKFTCEQKQLAYGGAMKTETVCVGWGGGVDW